MAKKQPKAFSFQGYRIVYSSIQKRWFVQDWDYETDYFDIGPSFPTKWAAMDWCCERGV